jgi:hypothetical protein
VCLFFIITKKINQSEFTYVFRIYNDSFSINIYMNKFIIKWQLFWFWFNSTTTQYGSYGNRKDDFGYYTLGVTFNFKATLGVKTTSPAGAIRDALWERHQNSNNHTGINGGCNSYASTIDSNLSTKKGLVKYDSVR